MVFGVILGAAARLAGGWPSRIAGAYVTFFRGTPELLILLLFYFRQRRDTDCYCPMAIDPAAGFIDIPPVLGRIFGHRA